MSDRPQCPQCGSPIPADSPSGLCPQCLLAAGLKTDASAASPDPASSATAASPARAGFVPPTVEELAQRFPQLEVLELLGRGGMGAVYKARQKGLDRLVALKILPPEVGQLPAFAERFTREARALARLSHPHIVTVYDFGQAGGLFYFLMEFIEGVNLRQAIATGDLKPEDALAIVPQICDALQFAHDEGVVHRDIKPENILVDKRGRVKIADFGLAKLMGVDQPEGTLTGTHQVMGTLRYMAPEQMEGTHQVDHRADIYSLGVVFYELLTRELPIGRFAPPSKKVQIDVRLDEIVLRALEKEPEQRYQHASQVKSEVEALQQGLASGSQTPSNVQVEREVLAYLPRHLLGAIGVYRQLTGATMVDARQAVEAIAARHHVKLPDKATRTRGLITVAIVCAATVAFLRHVDISSIIWVPIVLGTLIVPLGLSAWKYRGLQRGKRDAMLAGLFSLCLGTPLLGSLFDKEGKGPTRIYEITGVTPGKNDQDILNILFLGGVLFFLGWLIKTLFHLRAGRHEREASYAGRHGSWHNAGPVPREQQSPAAAFAATSVAPQAVAAGQLPANIQAQLLLTGSMLGFSVLVVIAGLVLLLFASVSQQPGTQEFWGWIGGALGCLLGGLGSLAGCWNGYRQLAGADDLMHSPRWTWFDSGAAVLGGSGLAALIAAAASYSVVSWTTTQALLSIGGALFLIGGLFIVNRAVLRTAALQRAAVTSSSSSDAASAEMPAVVRWLSSLVAVGLLVFVITMWARGTDDSSGPVTNGQSGPELPQGFIRRNHLSPQQARDINSVLQAYHREYLALERQHTKMTTDAAGRVHVEIGPFADECLALAKRGAKELGGLANQAIVPAQPQPGTLPPEIFREGGECRIVAELWKQGRDYHFSEKKSDWVPAPGMQRGPTTYSYSSPNMSKAFPERYRHFWTEK